MTETINNTPVEEVSENVFDIKEEEKELDTESVVIGEADYEDISSERPAGRPRLASSSLFVRHDFYSLVRERGGRREIKCNICKKEKFVSYQNANTSSMKAHLRSSHPEQLKKYQTLKEQQKKRVPLKQMGTCSSVTSHDQ